MPPRGGWFEKERKTEGMAILPDKKKMFERLVEFAGDNPDVQKRFYPLLVQKENRTVSPEGLVTIIAGALSEYAGMGFEQKADEMRARADQLIRALTPGAKDNPKIDAFRKKAEERWALIKQV
jgi:hypothetical protein